MKEKNLNPLAELEGVLTELNRTPYGRRAFLQSLPILFAACATPRHREREGENVQTTLSVQDEQKMTAEVLPEMKKEYPTLQNPELQHYISRLGADMAARSKLANNPYQYQFSVVGVPYVNAFALPAGTIFITAPLVAMAENEAELAGVVGHEIGHVKARHTAQRMDAAKKEQSKSWLYGVLGGVVGAGAGFGLGKLLCSKEDRECLARATALGAAAGAGGGLLIQKFAFMAHSREDELEADRIGFRTSIQSGFDKVACGTFYAKLLKMEESAKQNQNGITAALADALSTHPPSKERVQQMNQLAVETPQSGGRVNSEQFMKWKKFCQKWTEENKKKA